MKHQNRTDLAGEHRLGDFVQLLFLFLFLAFWILDSFFLKYSIFLTDYLPIYIRVPLAFSILSVSVVFAKLGLDIIFGEIRKEPSVVTKSVYNLVRHPVYLGCILFYLGLLTYSFSLISALVWLMIIALYYFLASHEEKLLLKKFGVHYENYKKRVPMLIPKLKKKS